MKKSYAIVLIVSLILTTAVLGIRGYIALNSREIESSEIKIAGITNGIALTEGEEIDGVAISVPSQLSAEELVSVSDDPTVAYILIDSEANEHDRVVYAKIIAVSPGITRLYVMSADGSVKSEIYTVNVVKTEASTGTATETEGTKDIYTPAEGEVAVFVTPSGKKYHLSSSCAGDNATGISLDDAVSKGYDPCKNCAVNK